MTNSLVFPLPSMQPLLTPEQVAEILQVHHLTVLKLIGNQGLRSYKLGRVYRIRQQDLEDFLEKHKV